MTNELNLEMVKPVPKPDKDTGQSLANDLKNLRRKRLQRKIYQDPNMVKELVRLEASPVYNARGEVIQAVTTNYGDA